MNPYTVMIGFVIVAVLFTLWKPQAARIFWGLFFLTMALGVNLTIISTNPQLYVDLGKNALIPFYRMVFTQWVAAFPALFVIPIILYQITVACLILSRGKWVRYGLIGGMLFCLAITPIGMEELLAPGVAAALALLLRIPFERSFPQMLFQRRPQKITS